MALRTVSNTGGNWNATTAWVGGVVPVAGDTVDFTVTSGNLTVNVATANLAGIDFTNYVGTVTFTNNINTNGTVNLGTGGYIQAGTGGLVIVGNTTITSNGVIWSRIFSVNFGVSSTITLSDNLSITNNVTLTNTVTASISINGNTLNIAGNFTLNNPSIISGTTTIILNGTGTWSSAGTGVLRNNLTINTAGTITISGNVYYNTGILTYTTGTVTTTGSTLNINDSTTLNTSGMTWNNIVITAGTQTLTSDLNCQNLTLNGNSNPTITSNKIYVLGNLTVDGTNSIVGTTEIILSGTGTWSNSSNAELRNNLTINTNDIITLGTNFYYGVGTLKYIKGKVITKNSTFNTGSSSGATTLINCHKINFNRVIIRSGATLTMNEFFSGSPTLKTTISASSTTNYTITFQDGFEKIAKFVDINGATITRRNQLLILTDSKKSSRNIGIRYINQSPNGIPKGDPSIQNILTPGLNTFLINDPTMIIK